MVYIKSLDLDHLEQLGIQMFFILCNLVYHLTMLDQNPSWILNTCAYDYLKFIQLEKWIIVTPKFKDKFEYNKPHVRPKNSSAHKSTNYKCIITSVVEGINKGYPHRCT